MDRAPVFVKIEEYKDIMDIITIMREKTKQAKFILDKITELKTQEDAEISTWSKELEEVETRIATIDKTLFEPNI